MRKMFLGLQKHITEHGVFYICFLLFAPLYVLWLNVLPFSVHGDEANTALAALDVLQKGQLIGVNWYDLPILSFWPHIFGMVIFGKNVVGDRMGSVVFGLGTLPFLYTFVTSWYSKRVGILATIFLATSNMWLALSRLGIAYVQAGFILVASVYLVWKTYTSKKLVWGICAGCMLGLSLYAYYAARITPIIIFPLIAGSIIFAKQKKIAIKQTAILAIFALAIMLPQLFYFAQHTQSFSSRTKEVFIFSNDGSVKTLRESQYPGESLMQVILAQTNKAVHVEKGDTGGQYGYKGWLLDPLTICFFILGLAVGIQKGKKKFLFLLYWFLFVLGVGVILTIDPIFVPRFVVGLPVIFIFAAVGFDYIFSFFKKNIIVQEIISIVLLLIIIVWNLQTYFVLYPQQLLIGKAGDRNALNATNISYYLNSLPLEYHALFLTPPNLYADFGTFQFLSPNTMRTNIQDPANFPIPYVCPKGTIYIIYPNYEKKYKELKQACPKASFFIQTDPEGTIEYYLIQTQL